MSEPRKNHLTIDGGQVKEDDHVASYKPIPETDTEFRTSKSNLSKSREKVSADGAEEKLLQKEDEAKIVTRVDMADAKYVVGDHRNGDAKIELDANKRQFSGLTKEELMKYADDPFWVNLRWFMFVLFWTAWLAMLIGAIAIIIQAPKCLPPAPRTWGEKGPLVDVAGLKYEDVEKELPNLKEAKVEGIFIDVPTYEVLDEPSQLQKYKDFFIKAKLFGIKVIVDLIPNYVSVNHTWFRSSVNKSDSYADYFVWRDSNKEKGQEPNNWLSEMNENAWSLNKERNQYYLHHYAADQPDLNFYNEDVKKNFEKALEMWMKAGVQGVRLNKVRNLLVDQSFADEKMAAKKTGEVDLTDRSFWEYKLTSDQPELLPLLDRWAQLVRNNSDDPEPVFTIKEEPNRKELYRSKGNLTMLKPPSTTPIIIDEDVNSTAKYIQQLSTGGTWPAIQLQLATSSKEAAQELARFALLLPATPIFTLEQIKEDNTTTTETHSLAHLVPIRGDASITHGHHIVAALTVQNSTELGFIACMRWKTGHNGYVAVFNPGAEDSRANLTSLGVPDTLTVHHISDRVKMITNYTHNFAEKVDNVLVPAHSSIVLSYVPPKETSEN